MCNTAMAIVAEVVSLGLRRPSLHKCSNNSVVWPSAILSHTAAVRNDMQDSNFWVVVRDTLPSASFGNESPEDIFRTTISNKASASAASKPTLRTKSQMPGQSSSPSSAFSKRSLNFVASFWATLSKPGRPCNTANMEPVACNRCSMAPTPTQISKCCKSCRHESCMPEPLHAAAVS